MRLSSRSLDSGALFIESAVTAAPFPFSVRPPTAQPNQARRGSHATPSLPSPDASVSCWPPPRRPARRFQHPPRAKETTAALKSPPSGSPPPALREPGSRAAVSRPQKGSSGCLATPTEERRRPCKGSLALKRSGHPCCCTELKVVKSSSCRGTALLDLSSKI